MAAITYSKKMMAERVKRHVANGFPNDEFTLTDNEIILYIDQAIAFNLIGKAYEGAKVEGALVVPEAFLVTTQLSSLTQDGVTSFWYGTLPQTPVSLPLGYSISKVYFAKTAYGKSYDALPIENKRTGFRDYMPKPSGCFYWVEGNRIWLQATDNQPLLNENCYVQMASTRTTDATAEMAIPDDIIQPVFDTVVKEIASRYAMPKDIINDNIPAGNNTQKNP